MSAKTSPLRPIAAFVQHDWGSKVLAFVITVVLFVFSRDEVTRTFTVPLRVMADPERVLLTPVPDTVSVQVRGPWTRVSRLESEDFGTVALDLAHAAPGPMVVDRGSIVMPRGVVLASLSYDEVDLRFDPVIERDVAVVPVVTGAPAIDHELVRVRSEPATVRIRGGRSLVLATPQLATVAFDLRDAAADVAATVALVRPPVGVTLVGEGAEPLQVRLVAEIAAKQDRRRVRAPIERDAALVAAGAFVADVEVELRGDASALRRLTALKLSPVVIGRAQLRTEEGRWADVTLAWAPAVPDDVRGALSFEPTAVRIELPPVPVAPAPTTPPVPVVPPP